MIKNKIPKKTKSKNKTIIAKSKNVVSKTRIAKSKTKNAISKTKKVFKDKSTKKNEVKKSKPILVILGIVIVAVIVGIFVCINNKSGNKNVVSETSGGSISNQVQSNNTDKKNKVNYTLDYFSKILESEGTPVSIETIGGNKGKKYKCLVSISDGIYEEFLEEPWVSPIVMNVIRNDGSEVVVTAKRIAGNEKVVYCDWYIGNDSYQVITTEAPDIADFLDRINDYIIGL